MLKLPPVVRGNALASNKNQTTTKMKCVLALLSSLIALAPAPVMALSFGELTLHSRMGEKLVAEIPLLPTEGDTLQRKCFSLIASTNTELPAPQNVRLTLIQSEQGFRLRLQGKQPIDEPALAARLSYGCNERVEKDLILVPEPPITPPHTSATPPPSLIDERPPHKPRRQPDLLPSREQPNASVEVSHSRSAKAKRPKADQLLLSATEESDSLRYPSLKIDWAVLEESESRLTRLEQQLGRLRQEITSIDREIEQARQQQAINTAKLSPMQPPKPTEKRSQRNWLEFLAALLLCAAVSAWVAHWYESRRRQR